MMMNEAFESLRGLNEFLAQEIYEGTLSAELANDVLFGRKTLEDAYAEYDNEIMLAMYEEYAKVHS